MREIYSRYYSTTTPHKFSFRMTVSGYQHKRKTEKKNIITPNTTMSKPKLKNAKAFKAMQKNCFLWNKQNKSLGKSLSKLHIYLFRNTFYPAHHNFFFLRNVFIFDSFGLLHTFFRIYFFIPVQKNLISNLV